MLAARVEQKNGHPKEIKCKIDREYRDINGLNRYPNRHSPINSADEA
jgi:hypothetical protein